MELFETGIGIAPLFFLHKLRSERRQRRNTEIKVCLRVRKGRPIERLYFLRGHFPLAMVHGYKFVVRVYETANANVSYI